MKTDEQSAFFDSFDEAGHKLLFATLIGLFTFGFMLVFQPFGVTNYDPDFRINAEFLFALFSISALVTLVLAVNEFMLRPLFIRRLNRVSLIAWLSWVYLLTGSTAFVIYNLLGNWHDFSLPSWVGFVRDVALIISFPIAGFLFYLRHQALKSDYIRLMSSPLESSDRLETFTSENGKDRLDIAVRDLLYLESEDNYVSIVYLDGDQPRTHLVRSSLKRLEDQVCDPQLARCHRSFIVNLARVRSCRGNRHGLRLKLKGMEGVVPVSRNYTDEILSALQPGTLT